ncbi:hypothetical protein FOZ63_028053 [Perkinsus olseni]|uniref:Uncharacterized protein n=1 Tax=Perkinsus olseni TaxID=32597 RepID=A0A7J6R066_PEROL|nr:hypothetical protein FOZ63_028053 [Perkinsus olseni]
MAKLPFIRTAVMLLLPLLITLVGGVATGIVDTPQKHSSNTTARRLYPFDEGYYNRDNTPIIGVHFDKTLGGTVAFYRASPQVLPKPSYACGYTAKQGGKLIEITLNNGCLPLIRDSHGSYDKTLLTGMRVRTDYSVLTVPKTGGRVDTYNRN